MISRLCCAAGLLAALAGCSRVTDGSTKSNDDSAPKPRPITIRIVNPDGKPIQGALLGDYVRWEEENIPHGLHGFGEQQADINGRPTDADGQFVLDGELAAKELEYGPQEIYAVAPDRKLVGLGIFGPDDYGKTVEVQLEPWCVVDVRVTSEELVELGQKFDLAQGYVYWGKQRPSYFRAPTPSTPLRFVLPPGKYELEVYGSRLVDGEYPNLEILPGQRQLILDVDLPASKLAKLIGKPAPDVATAEAWRNSKPLVLGDLQGKVVVLEFWGTWCGPCVGSMPKLVHLYKEFHEAGVEVVAVHTAIDYSLEDFDKRLASTSEKNWGGRPLPFPVAIDANEEEVEGRPSSMGTINSAYGISTWPTAVLIDREGRVVGEWNYRGDNAREAILEALANSNP